MIHPGILAVLVSAVLFGASTPLVRALVGTIDPLWLAGLLYAGSGVGLSLWLALRYTRSHDAITLFARTDAPWLVAAIVCGGVIAPVSFTFGLRSTTGATASLLLDLETVLTVALAWFIFGEHRNARVVAGMALIVVASVVLAWDSAEGARWSWGAPLIALACLGWAIDNNLTRKIAANDAILIAAAKGVVGGAVSLGLAALVVGSPPPMPRAVAAGLVGLFGYGVSLSLFIVALRHLGTARASAYYSVAPFIGVAVAFALLEERPDVQFWIALPLMAIGVGLHLTERHVHAHTHERLVHSHPHRHDEHHQHAHGPAWDGREPHTHEHAHESLTHAHPHYPDLHHRHEH